MKNQLVIFMIFLFSALMNESVAQPTFKTLIKGSPWAGANILQVDSGYILFDYDYNPLLCYIDTIGNIIQSTSIRSDSFSGPGGGISSINILYEKDQVIFPFINYSLSIPFKYCLTSFNYKTSTYNWIYGHNLNDTIPIGANQPLRLDFGFAHSIVLSTFRYSSWQNNPLVFPLVLTMDSVGVLKNCYLINNHYGRSVFTFQADNNSYISGINFTRAPFLTIGDTLGATLVKFDTTGQALWAKTYFTKSSRFYSAVDNEDGTITMLGAPDSTQRYFDKAQTFMMKVDTDGSVIWCKYFGDTVGIATRVFANQINKTNDGGYIMIGMSNEGNNYSNNLILIKTDANGDTLWTRCHGNAYTDDYGWDVNQTADGGYIACGNSNSAQFFLGQGGYYIIKTDSLGMTSSHCQEFNVPIVVTSISVPDSVIPITMTTGLVSSIPNVVWDSIYYTQQANGCWLSATGVEETESEVNPQVFPNPTTRKFTLKGLPVTQKVTLCIYDTQGREIVHRRTVNDELTEIDLTGRPPGIYLLRILAGETAWNVKVVLTGE